MQMWVAAQGAVPSLCHYAPIVPALRSDAVTWFCKLIHWDANQLQSTVSLLWHQQIELEHPMVA